ncbi:MAG: protein kinase domain-containing protein, partial [Candidatus Promineifilaceae bacterium]
MQKKSARSSQPYREMVRIGYNPKAQFGLSSLWGKVPSMYLGSMGTNMQFTRRLRVFLVLLLLLFVSVQTAAAQDGDNWLQAIVNGQLSLEELSGGTQFSTTPSLQGTFTNILEDGYNVFPVGGDILRPASGDYCMFVLAGDSNPMVIPPAGAVAEIEVLGYCLDLPDEAKKPDEAANYLPLNYGGQTVEAVRVVLDKAREGGLQRDFGTQVAVWQANTGLSMEQIQPRVGQDLTPYIPTLNYLLNDGPLPEPTEEPAFEIPTVVAEEEAPDEEAAAVPDPEQAAGEDTTDSAESGEDASDAGLFGLSRNMLLLLGVIGVMLFVSIILLIMAMRGRTVSSRRSTSRRPVSTRRRPGATSTTRRQAESASAAVQKDPEPMPVLPNKSGGTTISPLITGSTGGQKCLICGKDDHSTRECPEIQRPNQAFVPTEVELTLANVDDGLEDGGGDEGPGVPEIDPIWDGGFDEQTQVQGSKLYIEPPAIANEPSRIDDEFYEVAKMRTRLNSESSPDTSSVEEEGASDMTGPTSRKHVTYVVRQKGKPEVIGSLGDDGGVISRISLKDQQILLPPKDVSTPHALLRIRTDGRVTIKDLRSKNGTFVYGERIEVGKQVQLYDGTKLRFGDSAEFELNLSRRRLVSVSGGNVDRDLSAADQWLITRRNLHSVVIPNNQFSSPHLLVRPSDEVVSDIRVKDLKSHNPTIVDGNKILGDMEGGSFVKSEQIEFRVGKTSYVIDARSQKAVEMIGDQFKVVKQIYISKMADVYSVRDRRSPDAPLQAAKVLNIHQDKQSESRAAFDFEVKLMQMIANPHVLPIDAVGHDSTYDAPYFVMPFLQGADMRRIMHYRRRNSETGAMRLADIAAIVEASCSALDAIHDIGYAHCDVKPANIYVTPQSHVWMLDLGVATRMGENAEFFTQFYSAPEIGSKQLPPASPASDVYSLGVVLLEMLTGREAKDLGGFATEPAQPSPDTESSEV